ncbi:MAG: peptide chain release factor N(5)-glutamine methyltransferase [Eubacterium sp.]|nr:peptide chain release factor N(5)-glutamine methyltransferase [Eubacterium sp.]
MTYRELLKSGEERLKQVNIEDYRTDAWLLLEYVTNMGRSVFFAREKEEADEETVKAFRNLLEMRASHVPVQQLTGIAWFYGYPFKVSQHVLIPRQDTETLVEESLKRIEETRTKQKGKNESRQEIRILDLCTGSGCVLLTVLKELEEKQIPACGKGLDLSEEALNIARENRQGLGIEEEKAQLLKSDLFSALGQDERYDIITANPPYIRTDVIRKLSPEVRDHEPVLALDGGRDGLDILEKIAEEAPAYLKSGGWLLMEMGYDQGMAMDAFLRKLCYDQVHVIKDLNGNDRVILGRRNEKCLND